MLSSLSVTLPPLHTPAFLHPALIARPRSSPPLPARPAGCRPITLPSHPPQVLPAHNPPPPTLCRSCLPTAPV